MGSRCSKCFEKADDATVAVAPTPLRQTPAGQTPVLPATHMPVRPVCSRPGCGKQTWNNLPGFCSKTCKSLAEPGVATNPLGKSTEQPGGAAICSRPGCGKPTWNGVRGEFCGKACKGLGGAVGPTSFSCMRPGCAKPTWNGQENEFCGKTCRQASVKDTRTSNYFDIGEQRVEEIFPGSDKFDSASDQFYKKWKPETWNSSYKNKYPVPKIARMYKLNFAHDRDDYFDKKKEMKDCACLPGADVGNELRRFHGTRLKCDFRGSPCSDSACSICQIVESGKFLLTKSCTGAGTANYGNGMYFTAMSHTSKGYGLADGVQKAPFQSMTEFVQKSAGNAVFLALVLAGKAEKVDGAGYTSAMASKKMADLDTTQFNSRVVQKPNQNDELVIFDESQALPRYLIIFDGPSDATDPLKLVKTPDVVKALCMKSGCSRPTWNGNPNEYCGQVCRKADAFGKQVDQNKFDELQKQFTAKWNPKAGTCPTIKEIWTVDKQALSDAHDQYAKKIGDVKLFGAGANPGNKQRRFHSTKKSCKGWSGTPCSDSKCSLCCIINGGFDTAFARTGRFGPGLYSSSTPSKAYAYGDKTCQLIVSVACGVAEFTQEESRSNTTKLDESQFNSRVISDTGGNNDECIVYHNEAMVPRYLVVFS